jgi:hypothetical protein
VVRTTKLTVRFHSLIGTREQLIGTREQLTEDNFDL